MISSNVGPGVPIIFPDESYHVIIKSVLAPEIIENNITRDHTEIMLKSFGADIEVKKTEKM